MKEKLENNNGLNPKYEEDEEVNKLLKNILTKQALMLALMGYNDT